MTNNEDDPTVYDHEDDTLWDNRYDRLEGPSSGPMSFFYELGVEPDDPRLWTIIGGEEDSDIVAGYNQINAEGYILSTEPARPGETDFAWYRYPEELKAERDAEWEEAEAAYADYQLAQTTAGLVR